MKEQQGKFVYFLPNIFTALNMGCGFSSVVFSIQGRFYEACMILILGAIFDSVDGRIARLTGTESSFGEQFDSMSDLLSFGLAPSVLMYMKFLTETGRGGIIVAFVFVLCAALRLARFNANIDKVSSDYFQGLPVPGAAIALVGYSLISLEGPEYFNIAAVVQVYVVAFALLMISNLPFPSFKRSEKIRRNKRLVLVAIMSTFILLFLYEEVMVPAIIWTYTVTSLLYFFANRKKFDSIFVDDKV